jgi:hypothetical protein
MRDCRPVSARNVAGEQAHARHAHARRTRTLDTHARDGCTHAPSPAQPVAQHRHTVECGMCITRGKPVPLRPIVTKADSHLCAGWTFCGMRSTKSTLSIPAWSLPGTMSTSFGCIACKRGAFWRANRPALEIHSKTLRRNRDAGIDSEDCSSNQSRRQVNGPVEPWVLALLRRQINPRDWAHPCHICIRTRPAPTTSASGLSSPLPRLRRDYMGSPLPHLHQDSARPCHICTGTWLARSRRHITPTSPVWINPGEFDVSVRSELLLKMEASAASVSLRIPVAERLDRPTVVARGDALCACPGSDILSRDLCGRKYARKFDGTEFSRITIVNP